MTRYLAFQYGSCVLGVINVMQRLVLVLLLPLLRSTTAAAGAPTPQLRAVRPASQTSLLVAHGFAVDDVAHGPVWTETSGVGRFALDAERQRVLATIPFVKLLLLEDVVYVYNAKTPAALGPNCRKYLGGANGFNLHRARGRPS